MSDAALRWGVLGTANIAARAFLPAARAVGHTASVVGSRDIAAGAAWAEANEVARATTYDGVLEADDVDAVYVALPNDLHVQWAARAAATGKPVVCEKPLGLDADEVEGLLAQVGDALVWEAFAFPFHPQTERLARLCVEDGPIGGLREVVSEFHFTVSSPTNLRWSADHGGGALLDVGCYPVRLARLLFGAEPVGAAARSTSEHGVDAEFAGILDFPDDRRLLLSAGLRRAASTFTRLVGETGEVRVTNPFHPGAGDSVEVWRDGECTERWQLDGPTAFACLVAHVGEVVGGAAPRHLAAHDALGTARALDTLRAAAAVSA